MSEEPIVDKMKDAWSARSKDGVWSVRGRTPEEAIQRFRRVAASRLTDDRFIVCEKRQAGGE